MKCYVEVFVSGILIGSVVTAVAGMFVAKFIVNWELLCSLVLQ